MNLLSAQRISSEHCQNSQICALLQGALFGLPTAHRMDHAPGTPDAAAYNAEVALALKAAHNVLPRLVAVVLPTCVYTHKCLMGLALILAGMHPPNRIHITLAKPALFARCMFWPQFPGLAPPRQLLCSRTLIQEEKHAGRNAL